MADTPPRSQHTPPCLVWFREDLRLQDNPALHHAAATGAPIIGVFVLDEACGRAPGGAARWFLGKALMALEGALDRHRVPFVILKGDAQALIPDLARRTGARHVFWNDRVVPEHASQDDAIEDALRRDDIETHRSFAALLRRPGRVTTQAGTPYQVFGAYWRAAASAGDPPDPLPAPRSLHGAAAPAIPQAHRLNPQDLLPSHPDWATGIAAAWEPSEDAATDALDHFAERTLTSYDACRNDLGQHGTSEISAALRHGLLSPRQVWHAISGAGGRANGFRSELGWREFAYDTLSRTPDLATRNLRPAFDAVPWRRAASDLHAWQQGRTGLPVVDAGMRQLWQTGWMHNRARMITASFLVKHLLIDWRAGEAWFWDTLIDADPANNPLNWQWVAGTGIDSQQFSRIFNPILQAEKFDPSGAYVRRFVPELARLPDKLIHTPWAASPMERETAGIRQGGPYPDPIVDLKEGRSRALAAYRQRGGD